MSRRLFTSESVTEGHPDKIADQISDSILDAMIKDDPTSRVAVETLITTGQVHIAGEVKTATYVDIPAFHLHPTLFVWALVVGPIIGLIAFSVSVMTACR